MHFTDFSAPGQQNLHMGQFLHIFSGAVCVRGVTSFSYLARAKQWGILSLLALYNTHAYSRRLQKAGRGTDVPGNAVTVQFPVFSRPFPGSAFWTNHLSDHKSPTPLFGCTQQCQN